MAALVRSANSNLSWRDVKLILAASARKNDPDNAGWQTGALRYGSTTTDPEYYEFNHEYGFGVVDAEAAIDLAGSWNNLPDMRETGPVVASRRVSIPISGSRASSSVTVDSDIDFVEFVEVNTTFVAPDFRDLQVELVSPSGAVSVLSVPESANCPYELRSGTVVDCRLYGSFRFGSARHLGEDPSGTWTLRMADRLSGGPSNRLESWSITVYGHKATPEAPVLSYVDPGNDFLTVAWAPPDYDGTSDITGYDVRHIPSGASNKANDSAWTLIEGVGPDTTRRYTIAGLSDGLRRDVQVRAVNSRGDGDWSVTGRGTPGAINSEPFLAEGLEATRTVREDAGAGRSIGGPFTARDADISDTFTYSKGGRDAALFDINSSTGQFQVKETLNFEAKASHQVTVSVRDSKDADGNADTADDATIAVTVMVEDVDEPPELIGDTEIIYLENGVDEVIEFTAADPEGGTVMWEFSGTDEDDFDFDTGKLEFRSPPDYENPTDRVDPKNEYDVVVTVSDGARWDDVDVTVTVTNDNEPFTLKGDMAFDYDENTTGQVGSFSVDDDPENGPIAWELLGTDSGDFRLDSGVLSFADVPDYESPADSNRDNLYHVTVTAFDGANQKSLSVTVTVADLDEPGTVTLASPQPQVGTALAATFDDPDRGRTGITWSWESSASGSDPWDTIAGATSESYTPVDTDEGRYLRVTASYGDRHGTGKAVRAVSGNMVRAAPPTNRDPEFPSDVDTRSVAENTAQDTTTGRPVGAPVVATDTPADTLTYSLSGSHAALFEIDPQSGQLRTKVELNHESRSSYSVRVTATDPSDESAFIDVTVSVTNVEETGMVTFSSEFPQVGRSLTATLADPDRGTSNLEWGWHRSTSRFRGWALIDGAECTYLPTDTCTYLPTDADLDNYLRAVVQYNDRHEPQFQDSADAATVGTVSESSTTTTTTTTTTGGGGGGGGGGGLPEEPEEPEPAGFEDVGPRDVHAANIDALHAAGVARGCESEPLRFCPDRAVTRAQMASFLARTLELEAPAQRAGFEDVDPRSVHAANVEALFAAGVTVGCSLEPLRFCPDSAVTRAQMASFLVRALGVAPARSARFEDVDADGAHAASIDALYAAGIARGCWLEPLRYCPDRAVTRAQMASFLIRALDSSEESS